MQDRGFTLIENLVSMALLVLALTTGMALFHNAGQVGTLVVHKKYVAEMVNAKIEAIRQQSYATIASVAAQDIVVDGLDAQMTVAVTEIDDPAGGAKDYKEVDVGITWTEAEENGPREIIARTYIAP